MAEYASAVFKRLIPNPNFMTPNVLAHGFIGTGWVYEISEGTGLVGEPIFGVTVIDKETGGLAEEMGGLFDRKEAAFEWVVLMKEEQ